MAEKMNRRSFLQLIGAAAAAAAVGPAEVLASTPDRLETLVTRYQLLPGRPKVFGSYRIVAFALPAPNGQRCRAVLEVGPDDLKGVMVYPRGVMVFNGPAEVRITRVGRPDGPTMIMRELDAHVLNTDGAPCPVDWGVISRSHSLALEYEALGPGDEELYLALHFTDHDEGYTYPPRMLGDGGSADGLFGGPSMGVRGLGVARTLTDRELDEHIAEWEEAYRKESLRGLKRTEGPLGVLLEEKRRREILVPL